MSTNASEEKGTTMFNDPILRRTYSPELVEAAEFYLTNRFKATSHMMIADDPSGMLTTSAMLIVNGLSYYQPSETQIKLCMGMLGDAKAAAAPSVGEDESA